MNFSTSMQDIQSICDYECEYEPQIKNNNQKIKILLETTSQEKIRIIIDPNKTIRELIQFYFEKIKRPELFGDKSIRFILNANLFMHDSNIPIKYYLNKKMDVNTIVVDDLEDKIKPSLSN